MIIKEILEKQEPEVSKAVNELFESAKKNQSHPQDILLIIIHGFYDEKLEKPDKVGNKSIPFLIGPDLIGYSENTQYEFYDWYRKSHQIPFNQYKNMSKNGKEFQFVERMTINFETSVYLKFWESDMVLKRLYQLATLANGESYDWYFEIPINPRDGGKQNIIREKIRDRIQSICPMFYNLLKNTYKTQIRNAIAHSQYFLIERRIGLTNYSADPKAYSNLGSISFEDWAVYFYNTILLQNELIKNFNKFRDLYYGETLKYGSLDVRISKRDKTEFFYKVGFRNKDKKDWAWLVNIK